jgi:hypothetical protein
MSLAKENVCLCREHMFSRKGTAHASGRQMFPAAENICFLEENMFSSQGNRRASAEQMFPRGGEHLLPGREHVLFRREHEGLGGADVPPWRRTSASWKRTCSLRKGT